jgi:hypothetical protein
MVAPVVALTVTATGPLRLVASVVAATGHLPMVASLGPVGPVAGEVAQVTNRAGGMPPRLPLRKGGVRAMRLGPKRMLGIFHVPALPVLDGLLHRRSQARPPLTVAGRSPLAPGR